MGHPYKPTIYGQLSFSKSSNFLVTWNDLPRAVCNSYAAAGSELYTCTHFQFVVTLLQKIQHIEGDYIQLQEFFYQDLLTNRKHCYRFFRLIGISPLKKVEETNSTHRKFGRSVYFCSLRTSFSCIFFCKKICQAVPPFPPQLS